jgi:hypothetical protein
MPDIEGHEFAPYVWAAWPVHVERSDGTSITAGNETEVADFLKDDPKAMAAHAARAKMQADVRAIEVKADADIAAIRRAARAAIEKVQDAARAPAPAPVAPVAPVAPMPVTAAPAPPAAPVQAPVVPGQ